MFIFLNADCNKVSEFENVHGQEPVKLDTCKFKFNSYDAYNTV